MSKVLGQLRWKVENCKRGWNNLISVLATCDLHGGAPICDAAALFTAAWPPPLTLPHSQPRTSCSQHAALHYTYNSIAGAQISSHIIHNIPPRPTHYIASAYGLCASASGWAHDISVNSGNTPFNFALINFASPRSITKLFHLCSPQKASSL